MKSINEYIGQELRWVHPQLRRREYELRAGDEVLARISYTGALSSQVRVETATGLWTGTHRRTYVTQEAYQSGVARVNNTELYYDVACAGHPLTLIHGMALDRSSWDDQFGVFAGQYRVVRYDMRGWGDSAQEQAEPPFSPRQDLLSLLDYLNIHKTYLLGLSGGGTVALDFTLEHPERVDALILVAAGLSGYPLRMTESIQAFFGQYYGAL